MTAKSTAIHMTEMASDAQNSVVRTVVHLCGSRAARGSEMVDISTSLLRLEPRSGTRPAHRDRPGSRLLTCTEASLRYIALLCIVLQGMQIDKDLVAASATPLVLAILAKGESYGYAILKRVRELSSGELEWTDGMLYPLLHRLERLGYVKTDWRTPPEGRRRKYYAITDDGRRALADQQRQWSAVSRALNNVWPGGGLLAAVGEA